MCNVHVNYFRGLLFYCLRFDQWLSHGSEKAWYEVEKVEGKLKQASLMIETLSHNVSFGSDISNCNQLEHRIG